MLTRCENGQQTAQNNDRLQAKLTIYIVFHKLVCASTNTIIEIQIETQIQIQIQKLFRDVRC